MGVVIEHRKRQELCSRIALRTADVKHRGYIDEAKTGQITLHRLQVVRVCAVSLLAIIVAHLVHAANLDVALYAGVIRHFINLVSLAGLFLLQILLRSFARLVVLVLDFVDRVWAVIG